MKCINCGVEIGSKQKFGTAEGDFICKDCVKKANPNAGVNYFKKYTNEEAVDLLSELQGIKKEITPEEKYSRKKYPENGDLYYMVMLDLLREIKALKKIQNTNRAEVTSIKNMVLFFVVLTAISLITSIVSVASIASAF